MNTKIKFIIKIISKVILGIILILSISYIIIYGTYYINNNFNSNEDIEKQYIDSLKNEINKRTIVIDSLKVINNYLENNKTQIHKHYETTIQNISNPSIVSDDSITRYISEKIYSK